MEKLCWTRSAEQRADGNPEDEYMGELARMISFSVSRPPVPKCYFDAAMVFRAAAITASVVNPKCFCRSFQGAEAPKLCMPIICPLSPT